ncbi:MAG: glycosyltransferase, partial [Proteobacteria bacterium]
MIIDQIASSLGLAILYYRLRPFQRERAFEPLAVSPRVSIIVPCRNEEKNVGNLLTTLVALEYSNLEIIIVDDGSSDLTAEIASKF